MYNHILASHHFNPRSPHGERHAMAWAIQRVNAFQPTLPARGATRYHFFRRLSNVISTHAPRTGSDGITPGKDTNMNISTHAPRTGSDKDANWLARLVKISTHAPRTGSDTMFGGRQSSLWNFNPRSPHGERPSLSARNYAPCISTHAPRTGSDTGSASAWVQTAQFQPTLPARGATSLA